MAQFTTRANLQLPGGGSSGTITPDETADIDVLNENFRKIDAALGAVSVPTEASIPSGAMDGQLFWVRDKQQMFINDIDLGGPVPSATRIPAGFISLFGGESAPEGYLLCRGQEVSRTVYSELYAAIGVTYGKGNDSTTFNVPDLRGRVPAGFNSSETEFNSLGKKGGAKTHKLTVAQMPKHRHTISSHRHKILGGPSSSNRGYLRSSGAVPARDGGSKWHPWFGGGYGAVDTVHSDYQGGTISEVGSGSAHPNLQPYIALNYVISTGK